MMQMLKNEGIGGVKLSDLLFFKRTDLLM